MRLLIESLSNLTGASILDIANRMISIDSELSETERNWNHNVANGLRTLAKVYGSQRYDAILSRFKSSLSQMKDGDETITSIRKLDAVLADDIKALLSKLDSV